VSGRRNGRPDASMLAGLPAALWGRVSGKIQESDGYSLPNQQRRCHETAAELGVNVIGQDFEQGSGQDWDLVGINRWLRAAKHGTVKVLILKNVSRLSRSRGRQAWIEDLARSSGLILYYYDEEYEATPAGNLQRGIMAEVAEFQLEQARADSMAARYEKVSTYQRPVGNGPLPYGWRRIVDRSGAKPRTVGYEHHPEHAEIIRRFRALRTLSTRELCDQLQAEGVPTPALYRPSEKRPLSGRWEPYVVRHILQNRMVWGEYVYGERERYRVNGKWRQRPKPDADVYRLQLEPILEQAEVEALRAILSSRHRGATTSASDPDEQFMLRGLLVCGLCTSTLRTQAVGSGPHRTGGADRYYRCPLTNRRTAERQGRPRCTLPPLAADRRRRGASGEGIEGIVWAGVAGVFSSEARLLEMIRAARAQDDSAAEHGERMSSVRRQLAEARAEHDRAAERAVKAEDALAADSYEAIRSKRARDVRSFEAELRQLETIVPRGIGDDEEAALLALGQLVRAVLPQATDADKRRFCAELSLRVWVRPVDVGGYAVGRHRYELEGAALGQPLRGSSGDNLSKLSLQLLRSDRGPTVAVCSESPTSIPSLAAISSSSR
jgi:DNA invertase Pin-like site-specific DNA recombinase